MHRMQCVILAAGRGTRLRPLTEDRPKPLVDIAGKPLLFHILERLPDEITEVIIVVGYKGEQIVQSVGARFGGKVVRYIWQEEQRGTAHALGLCRECLRGKFLLLNADDVYDTESLRTLIKKDLALLAHEHEHPEWFGVIVQNADGTLGDIIEKPRIPPSRLVSTGAMVLDERLFEYEPKRHESGEYFIPTQLAQLAKAFPVDIVPVKTWVAVGRPEDVYKAEKILSVPGNS